MSEGVKTGSSGAPRVRWAGWWILVLSSLASVISLVDRQTVAVLKSSITARFAIGDSEYGLLVTAFLAAYAVFFIVCGRMVDRFGSRPTLTLFIALWSIASIASGFARSYPELALYRAVLGAAEAGLTPATIYALMRWFPKERLATAYGLRGPIIAMGPILAPPIIVGLAVTLGWRSAFWAPGLVGLAFSLAWWMSDRRLPAEDALCSAPDPTPFRTVLSSKALWILVAARLTSDPLWFFLQHWQAGYFQEVLGLSLIQVGRWLWIPPLASAVLTVGVTAWSDHLLRAGCSVVRSRVVVMQVVAVLAPVTAVIPFVSDAGVAILLFTAVQTLCLSWLFLSNVLLTAFFGKDAIGTAAGVLNAIGTASAALLSPLTGLIVEHSGYRTIFLVGACLHPVAALILYTAHRRGGQARRGPTMPTASPVQPKTALVESQAPPRPDAFCQNLDQADVHAVPRSLASRATFGSPQ